MNPKTLLASLCKFNGNTSDQIGLERHFSILAQVSAMQEKCPHKGIVRIKGTNAIAKACLDCGKNPPAYPFLYR